MSAPFVPIPECMAYESCKAMDRIKCLRCLHMPIDTWQRTVRKRIYQANKIKQESLGCNV
jgi:hypothetical protein